MNVRDIRPAEIPAIAASLTAAFEEDPFSRWMFGPDEGLRRRLRASFTALLRVVYLPKGYAYTTDDLCGAALWSAPGRWRFSTMQQLRIAPTFVRVLGPRRLARAAPAGRAVDHAHPKEPHWYLSVLGVDPARQRSGIGSALLRPMLARADSDGLITYLETSNEVNVPYYERHGFEVRMEFDIPRGGPRLWTMGRRPGAGSAKL